MLTKNYTGGSECFSLLGINLSVNLQQVPSLNYEPALNNIRASLAPFEKITVLKSFIMSKLNYLFLCIPDPSKNFIKTLERLFFKFIWNDKPDKIRRNTICMNYKWGGGGGGGA